MWRVVFLTSRDGIPYGCWCLVFQSSKCWLGESFGRIFEAAFILGDMSIEKFDFCSFSSYKGAVLPNDMESIISHYKDPF